MNVIACCSIGTPNVGAASSGPPPFVPLQLRLSTWFASAVFSHESVDRAVGPAALDSLLRAVGLGDVGGGRQNLKVNEIVVETIFVDMVDVFFAQQYASEVFLHQPTRIQHGSVSAVGAIYRDGVPSVMTVEIRTDGEAIDY